MNQFKLSELLLAAHINSRLLSTRRGQFMFWFKRRYKNC